MAKEKAEPEAVQAAEVFDAKEIAENAPRLFGYSHDLTATALELAGIDRCTIAEAEKITKQFAERKVN